MRIVLVDDEPLALKYFSKQLLKLDNIEIVGKCMDGKEALQVTDQVKPDVVFLDIQMSEMDGIETAELLMERHPHLQIIFVTAFEEYAVKAFELNAVDYLLKPVKLDRLQVSMERIKKRISKIHAEDASENSITLIQCFKNLHLHNDVFVNIPWRTNKALELFSYLLHHRKANVLKEQIIDVLWPDIEPKKAFVQLYGTIYQIRKLLTDLSSSIEILNSSSGYLLQLHETPIDIERWESLLQQLPGQVTDESMNAYIDCVQMYKGDYLADHGYLWAEAERERLRVLWLQVAHKLSEYYFGRQQWNDALHIYLRIIEMFPAHEDANWQVLKIYNSLNNKQALEKHYTHFAQLLFDEYELEVPSEIQEWYLKSTNKLS